MKKTSLKKAVVVLSGGQDSATCLALAVRKHGADAVAAITFRYGQRHGIEVRHARALARHFGVTAHKVVALDFYRHLTANALITAGGALSLALGIAIQNFPEGAIISMPLHAQGQKKPKAFLCGVLSGVVEPIFGVLTVIFAALIVPVLPYLLSFAAGAMIYVVVEELIPEMSQGKHSDIGVLFFAAGFTVMMSLDVALG